MNKIEGISPSTPQPSEHHQTGPTLVAREFWTGVLWFAPPGPTQPRTTYLRGTPFASTTRTKFFRWPTERHGKVGGRPPPLPSDGCPPLARAGGPDLAPGCFGRLEHLLLCRFWWRSPEATHGGPLREHKLPGDGHENQVVGHTGKWQTTKGRWHQRRRRSSTRKHSGSKRVATETRAVKKRMLATGPL